MTSTRCEKQRQKANSHNTNGFQTVTTEIEQRGDIQICVSTDLPKVSKQAAEHREPYCGDYEVSLIYLLDREHIPIANEPMVRSPQVVECVISFILHPRVSAPHATACATLAVGMHNPHHETATAEHKTIACAWPAPPPTLAA